MLSVRHSTAHKINGNYYNSISTNTIRLKHSTKNY